MQSKLQEMLLAKRGELVWLDRTKGKHFNCRDPSGRLPYLHTGDDSSVHAACILLGYASILAFLNNGTPWIEFA